MTYYLKYRPQTFSDVVGQPQVKERLYQAFLQNKLVHAYLFCGLRGTGKTSTARILAKMVNCQLSVVNLSETEKQTTGKLKSENRQQKTDNRTIPCNKCDSCISITNGTNLDLIEIDAASNRGIDDIRDLRDKIKLAPTAAKKKVYIIDEAHMLTPEAFNALLKTLEEPPQHVLFILATTEPHKIPQTIMSRVQRLDFQQATSDDLVKLLKNVAEKEKIKIDDDALKLVAKKGDGSFRDGLKLLEQLSLSGESLSVESVEQHLLSGTFEDVINLLDVLSDKDSSRALQLLNKQLGKGVRVKDYLLSILDILRSMLLIRYNVLDPVKVDLGSSRFEVVSKLTEKFTPQELVSVLESFQQALEKIKSTSHPSLPLEIAVVESSQLSVFSESVTDKLITDQLNSENLKQKTDHRETDNISETPNSDMPKLLDKWTYILETIKPYNYSLEALLKQAKILSCDGGVVLLEVPYSFHQRILESPKNRALLESVLSDVLAKEVKVSCILGVRPIRIEELANVELAADDEVIRIAAEIFNSEPIN